MTESKSTLQLLAIDNDPATVRDIQNLIGDPGLVLHFADTGNAVSRILESEDVDLAVMHIHAGSIGLLAPLSRHLQALEPPIALVAVVDSDPASASAAAAAGVQACVRIDEPRAIRRILGERIELIRTLRQQAAMLHQVADIHERYNLLLESSREAIAYLHQGLHIYANPSYLQQFGYETFEELEGYSILDLLSSSGDDQDLKQLLKSLAGGNLPDKALDFTAVCANGSTFRAGVRFSPARYDGESCTQIMVRERIEPAQSDELQQELEMLRTRDLLTGLLNRQAFIRALHEELEHPPEGQSMAVLLLTLTDHAGLQAKIGTAATDLLIRQSAEMLLEVTSEDMLPARLSDHVMALRIWFHERSEAESLARKLVGNYSGRILEIRDKSPTVTASVGLAIGGGQMFSADELLSQAGSALQDVEHAGGNGYARYQPPATSSDSDDVEQWTEKLRHALNNNEFRLVRLPITSMEDDSFVIYEIETRLRTEDSDEIILPGMFRPAAIQSGLAVDVDRDQIRHLLRWHESNPSEHDPFLVTISAQSLSDDEFIEWLQGLVDARTLDGRRLILGLREPEIRESLREAQRLISRFGARGVRFALLDVEPDCRIELLLKNININFIKLSAELSVVLRRDEHKRAALRKMTAAAAANDIQVISPQVENTSDLAALWQFGVTLIQDDFVREEQV